MQQNTLVPPHCQRLLQGTCGTLLAHGDRHDLPADSLANLQRRFDGIFVKPVNDRIDVGRVEDLHGRIIDPKTLFGSLWIWDLFEGDNDIHTSLLRAALSYGVA